LKFEEKESKKKKNSKKALKRKKPEKRIHRQVDDERLMEGGDSDEEEASASHTKMGVKRALALSKKSASLQTEKDQDQSHQNAKSKKTQKRKKLEKLIQKQFDGERLMEADGSDDEEDDGENYSKGSSEEEDEDDDCFKPPAPNIAPSVSASAICEPPRSADLSQQEHSKMSGPVCSNDGRNQEVVLGTSSLSNDETGDDNENIKELGVKPSAPEKLYDNSARAHMSDSASSDNRDNVEKGNDDPGSEKEDMKKRVLDYIPKEVQEQYREVCFGLYSGKFFPGIQLGPFDVPFGGGVQDNYVKMAKKVSCFAQLI
jgi:hypothetical protein